MVMTDAIEVKNLIKRYKKSKENAVDDVSFSVGKGEFFALLGPNGAGKTTTISVLTTTLSKTSGRVTIAGHDLDKNANKVRKNIGVIFQKPSLDDNLTAEENVRFHAVLYGLYSFKFRFAAMPASYKKKVLKLANLLGIKKDIHKPIKTFSGGMKRKLEILRSLMHDPKILFLDEPTAGLDPVSRKNVWGYIQYVRKHNKTTIFLTTHYLEEAEEADNVAIINSGKIITCGTPNQLKKELTKVYVEMDADNKEKLIGELKTKGFTFEDNKTVKVFPGKKTSQEVIKAINTKLDYLDIHNPSLEEAYLDIIENQTNKS